VLRGSFKINYTFLNRPRSTYGELDPRARTRSRVHTKFNSNEIYGGWTLAIAKICCARVSPEGSWVLIWAGKNPHPHIPPHPRAVPYLFLWASLFACRFVRQQPNKKCIKSVWVWEETTVNKHFGLSSVCSTLKSFRAETTRSSHLHGRWQHCCWGCKSMNKFAMPILKCLIFRQLFAHGYVYK